MGTRVVCYRHSNLGRSHSLGAKWLDRKAAAGTGYTDLLKCGVRAPGGIVSIHCPEGLRYKLVFLALYLPWPDGCINVITVSSKDSLPLFHRQRSLTAAL